MSMNAYWAREALETYESDPTGNALLRLLQRLTEAVEELEREMPVTPTEERIS